MKKEIQEFADYLAINHARASEAYPKRLEQFRSFVQGKPLESVSVRDVRHWLDLEYTRRKGYGPQFSLVILRAFLRYWQKRKRLKVFPDELKGRAYTTTPHKAVTKAQFQRMERSVKEDRFFELEKKLILHFLWYGALRVSEVRDLNISDINWGERCAKIYPKKKRGNVQPEWFFWPKSTHALLVRFLGSRLTINQQPWLFVSRTGNKRITTRLIQRWWKEISEGVGIVGTVPHSTRHGRALRIRDKGGDVKAIQVALRHSQTNPAASFHYLRNFSFKNTKKTVQKYY